MTHRREKAVSQVTTPHLHLSYLPCLSQVCNVKGIFGQSKSNIKIEKSKKQTQMSSSIVHNLSGDKRTLKTLIRLQLLSKKAASRIKISIHLMKHLLKPYCKYPANSLLRVMWYFGLFLWLHIKIILENISKHPASHPVRKRAFNTQVSNLQLPCSYKSNRAPPM